MTEHDGRNPWRRPRDGDPRMTDATDGAATAAAADRDQPAERAAVDRDRPTDAYDTADRSLLRCTFDERETSDIYEIGNWYAQQCLDHGLKVPPDPLRAVIQLAMTCKLTNSVPLPLVTDPDELR